MPFDILPLTEEHRAWAHRVAVEHWASDIVVTRGRCHDTSRLPGFVAERDGELTGLITYNVENGECEVISFNSLVEREGIGTALMLAVKRAAERAGCRRVWLVTTNDNLRALGWYQKRGFVLKAVYANSLEESRKLKPQIPLVGTDGIPLRDEIELELVFS